MPVNWRMAMEREFAELRQDRQRLFEGAVEAIRHLENLQVHIAQLPKQYRPFIDSHVDMAMAALDHTSRATGVDLATRPADVFSYDENDEDIIKAREYLGDKNAD